MSDDGEPGAWAGPRGETPGGRGQCLAASSEQHPGLGVGRGWSKPTERSAEGGRTSGGLRASEFGRRATAALCRLGSSTAPREACPVGWRHVRQCCERLLVHIYAASCLSVFTAKEAVSIPSYDEAQAGTIYPTSLDSSIAEPRSKPPTTSHQCLF